MTEREEDPVVICMRRTLRTDRGDVVDGFLVSDGVFSMQAELLTRKRITRAIAAGRSAIKSILGGDRKHGALVITMNRYT